MGAAAFEADEVRLIHVESVEHIPNDVPVAELTWESIERQARRAKKLTAAGPSQLTPFLTRLAIEHSTDGKLAKLLAVVGRRMTRGEFPTRYGAIEASCMLLGLYKDGKQIDVRPIAVGDSERRLIVSSYMRQLFPEMKEKTQDHQLGFSRAVTKLVCT